ncbi:MAG: sigma-70 family RNA polymerase sigma factor [Planctomycetes bacterium]|nr:sigma-70 family RNA polymerase sigma factor [Planctomycetota bacterium]
MDSLSDSGARAFPGTRPSLVALVAKPLAPEYREAWGTFFRGYWPPLYAFLRRSGSTREEALDLLQDFFLQGLEGRILAHYDPSRGKLRTFLLACLSNLRKKAKRHDRARPDGRAFPIHSTEEGDAILATRPGDDPQKAFEEEWIRQVQARSRASLEARLRAAGDVLSLRLLAEWVFTDRRPAGAALAKELGITPGDLYTRATRLRQAFASEVEVQVGSYSPEPAAERDEILSSLVGEAPAC